MIFDLDEHWDKLGEKGMALLIFFAELFLDSIWDGLWEVIFNAVKQAEEEWQEGDFAREKKEFVIEAAINFVRSQRGLNFIEGQVIRTFLSMAIDQMIASFNDKAGKNWVEKVQEIEDNLDDYIPYVD